jgi:23S rRNA (cytosine1962-C5)-methyltransferase
MSDEPAARPAIALLPGRHKRVAGGHPWAYSNEIAMDAATKALAPGSLVTLRTAGGETLGGAIFNPHTLVSARILDRDPAQTIDEGWFTARLTAALRLRESLFDAPYYRLIHAEADGLPGAILDRFGDVLVCEINTAGLARLEGELLAACARVLRPQAIILRNDSASRRLEGLAEEQRIVGAVSLPIEIAENGARFLIDPVGGQKTGWFFDQRDNRRFMARLASGRSVLDLFCFAGGFAIQAALAGAREVLGIDRSEPALALARASAELNGVGERCRFERGEVFERLEQLVGAGKRFDIVIADPPAFVKSRKDLGAGLRGYRKLTRLAAAVVAPGGFLFIASCSHNVEIAVFAEAVRRGAADAGRSGRILMSAGAAPDHPVHPFLPESAYLKAQVLALD